jgi:hypothetical protein
MQPQKTTSRWKSWFKPSRIIPMLTIVGAGTAIVLSLLNMLELSLAENIIIALIALLAIDALTERLSILDVIEARLQHLSANQMLRSRNDLPTVDVHAAQATEICFIAISGISLRVRYFGFLENKIKSGCKIKVILLDPEGIGVEACKLISRVTTADSDIRTALESFKELSNIKSKGKFEVRLSQAFIPFTLQAVDLHKPTGSMVVEYHTYKKTLNERPHILLTALDNNQWFEFYKQQFEQAWNDSTVWCP